jgi:hypothetical protein
MPDDNHLLEKMLAVAGVPVKASYNPGEVCRLLGVSYHTFRKMCLEFERIDGRPKPGTIDSFYIRGERRIPHPELVRYLEDNNAYHVDSAARPEQMSLF